MFSSIFAALLLWPTGADASARILAAGARLVAGSDAVIVQKGWAKADDVPSSRTGYVMISGVNRLGQPYGMDYALTSGTLVTSIAVPGPAGDLVPLKIMIVLRPTSATQGQVLPAPAPTVTPTPSPTPVADPVPPPVLTVDLAAPLSKSAGWTVDSTGARGGWGDWAEYANPSAATTATLAVATAQPYDFNPGFGVNGKIVPLAGSVQTVTIGPAKTLRITVEIALSSGPFFTIQRIEVRAAP